ncbi:MAG: DUF4124 domain-containing protein [Methylophilaceae bacterium]
MKPIFMWIFKILLIASVMVVPVKAEIYKYKDAKGNTVYSDKPTSSTSQTVKNTTSQATSGASTVAADQTVPVKWHPGHYVMVYPQGTSTDASHKAYMDSVIQEVGINPAFQGIQKQYFWNKLEPAKGVYDFSEIKKDLAALALVHKRLVVSFQERSYNTGDVYAPKYLLTSEYAGGVYSYNSGKGFNVNYWHEGVQDRLVALVTEMGKQLNGYSNLEAVNLEETAHSNHDQVWVKNYSTKYYNGVIRVALATKTAFPNTVVIQYINYADWNMDKIVSAMVGAGIGLGGPDVSEKDTGLLNTSYQIIQNQSGKLPIGMAVQYLNYDFNNGRGPKDPPSIASIHAFAQNTLKANYIFWMRRTKEPWNGSDYYQDILIHMNTLNWTASPKGGLDTKCPTLLKACNTN